MRRTSAAVVLLVAPLMLLGLAGASQAQLVLYDDFNVKPINPAKWFGTELSPGPAAPNTEAIRKISQGHLKVDLTTYGRTDFNTGTGGEANEGFWVTNPSVITTFQTDVAVKSVHTGDCPANPTGTSTSAIVIGAWFNDGTSPGPGDRTGDINAGIVKSRSSKLGDAISAFITRCTNASCSTRTTVGSYTFTTPLTRGVFDALRIQWDRPNRQFIFAVNQEQAVLAYPFSDVTPAALNFKRIGAISFSANCMPPNPRTSAIMKVLFDNVMVNP